MINRQDGLKARAAWRDRGWQYLLIASTLGCCWLGMMVVHELGHVLHAWLTGGAVTKVVLHPFAISRTDVSPNPRPLIVAWGGPSWGSLAPVSAWLIARQCRWKHEPPLAVWAGFCLIANGCYLGIGSFQGIGDAGDLLQAGAARWQLWLFGGAATLMGLFLWNGRGSYFGLGRNAGSVSRGAAQVMALACFILLLTMWGFSG